MSTINNTTSDEVIRLWWAINAYNRIVSDCLLSAPDGEELTPAIENLVLDIENRLKRILGAL